MSSRPTIGISLGGYPQAQRQYNPLPVFRDHTNVSGLSGFNVEDVVSVASQTVRSAPQSVADSQRLSVLG